GRLPHSLRELRLFVERVWDRRRSRGTPMADSVGAEEIAAALSTGGSASKHRELRAAKETPTIHLIKDLLSGIREEGGLEGLSALSEAEAQALVYCVKRFAFDLAVWYGGSNKAKQRRTYGMPNPKAFDKLVGDPEILRPDAKKRRK
ncbi:MAG TPA: hypothetical protein VNA25_01095, partial [Phycisphaerae bacterium]|nr:hypothetical protein [Phycisphaerae bacterium]